MKGEKVIKKRKKLINKCEENIKKGKKSLEKRINYKTTSKKKERLFFSL